MPTPHSASTRSSYILGNLSTAVSWTPTFCWHAFRYAAVALPAGLAPLTAADVTCWPVHIWLSGIGLLS